MGAILEGLKDKLVFCSLWRALCRVVLVGTTSFNAGCGAIWINASTTINNKSAFCQTGNRLSQTPYAGGSGTASDPFQICTATQMNNIGLNSSNWSANFILESNIDLSAYTGTQFNLIGNLAGASPFTGVFNGNKLIISNFTYVNGAIASGVGLFAYIGNLATIENLTLFNPSVSGGAATKVGTLVGSDDNGGNTSLINVSAQGPTATISGAGRVGGVVGNFTGTINGASSSLSLTSTAINAGGIVGYYGGSLTLNSLISAGTLAGKGTEGGLVGYVSGGNLTNSQSSMSVTETGTGYTGGLIGEGFGNVTNCFNLGPVSGTSSVGGIEGTGGGIFTNVYATGTISNCLQDCGGVIGGASFCTITNSYFSGTVNTPGALYVGGVTGEMFSCSMTGSYAVGIVSGSNHVGGISGYNSATSITNSYFSGTVTGVGTRVGGAVGYLANNSSVSASFALGSVSGGTNVGGLVGNIVTVGVGFGVYNSYSQASVTSSGSKVGGLIGTIGAGGGNNPDVQNSYASGFVSGSATLGGITGTDSGTGAYVKSYFDVTVNPGLVGVGAGGGSQTAQNGVNVFATTTPNMQSAITFSTWSAIIWNLVNGTYQTLAWQ